MWHQASVDGKAIITHACCLCLFFSSPLSPHFPLLSQTALLSANYTLSTHAPLTTHTAHATPHTLGLETNKNTSSPTPMSESETCFAKTPKSVHAHGSTIRSIVSFPRAGANQAQTITSSLGQDRLDHPTIPLVTQESQSSIPHNRLREAKTFSLFNRHTSLEKVDGCVAL